MKKTLTFLIAIMLAAMAFGQGNSWKYPITIGLAGTANGQITLNGSTSGSVVLKANVVAGTGTIFQLPNTNGTNGYFLQTNGSGATSWADALTPTEGDARYLQSVGASNLNTLVTLQTDTVPLITFGVGAGLAADTALMNNNVLAGSFYNEGSDSLHITQLVGILKEGTGTETISVQISWHATFLSGSATNLNASALAITSMTTGTVDTSFANAVIPPNVFVWCILSGASANNKPTFLNVTLSGYKQNLRY